jgi:hypothetical protein
VSLDLHNLSLAETSLALELSDRCELVLLGHGCLQGIRVGS